MRLNLIKTSMLLTVLGIIILAFTIYKIIEFNQDAAVITKGDQNHDIMIITIGLVSSIISLIGGAISVAKAYFEYKTAKEKSSK